MTDETRASAETDAAETADTIPALRTDEDQPDFGIDSDEGNDELRRMLADVVVRVQRGEVGRSEAVVLLGDSVADLSTRYPEVTDITVRTAIVETLDPVFTGEGWERLEPFEF